MHTVQIDPQWKKTLSHEFMQPYWTELSAYVRQEYLTNIVYPPPKDVFRAYNLCPFDRVKVVIVGQDPYHGPHQANGLCFAVHEGIPLPPSLKNIYKEIHNDLKIEPSLSGDLSRWAKQGVLLLNATLTVRANTPTSHSGRGWERFTDATIAALNAQRKHIVYLLWGKYAQNKGSMIDRTNNLVLSSGHPSPFSAHLFYGNHHFSACNGYLTLHGKQPVDWR